MEKQKERMGKKNLRNLSETLGVPFGAAKPMPDSKTVVFWLNSDSWRRTLGENFPIPGTVLGILGKEH